MATDTDAEAKKNVVRQYMDALNNNDLPSLIALMTPDYDDHMTMPGVPTGREGAIFAHKMLESAFPDVHFTIEDLLVEGDRVVVMSTGRGTHKGDFFGLPP